MSLFHAHMWLNEESHSVHMILLHCFQCCTQVKRRCSVALDAWVYLGSCPWSAKNSSPLLHVDWAWVLLLLDEVVRLGNRSWTPEKPFLGLAYKKIRDKKGTSRREDWRSLWKYAVQKKVLLGILAAQTPTNNKYNCFYVKCTVCNLNVINIKWPTVIYVLLFK